MVLKNKGAKLGPMEIRYRALAKLLRQIEQLEEKEKLDAQQTKKVKRKAFIEDIIINSLSFSRIINMCA